LPDISKQVTRDELARQLAELEARLQRLLITVVSGAVVVNIATMIALVKLLGH
jgi:hypothetical protein